MGPDVLGWCVFIHYNWQYECLRPSWDEIVTAYMECFGREPVEADDSMSLRGVVPRQEAWCHGCSPPPQSPCSSAGT